MATRISDIFAALAAMQVVYNGSVVTTYNLDLLPEAIYSADTPCRLLLTLGTRLNARSVVPITLTGSVATINWSVVDLFLLKTVGVTEGLATECPALLQYIRSYFDAAQQLGFRLTRYATIESATFEMLVVEYPTGSGIQFFAVETILNVKEIAQ